MRKKISVTAANRRRAEDFFGRQREVFEHKFDGFPAKSSPRFGTGEGFKGTNIFDDIDINQLIKDLQGNIYEPTSAVPCPGNAGCVDQSVCFKDSFSRVVASGWGVAPNGVDYRDNNLSATSSVSDGVGVIQCPLGVEALTGPAGVTIEPGCDQTFPIHIKFDWRARTDIYPSDFYVYYNEFYNRGFYISDHDGGEIGFKDQDPIFGNIFPWALDQWFTVKIVLDDAGQHAKIWRREEPEPTFYMAEYSQTISGTIFRLAFLSAHTSGDPAVEFEVDNLTVKNGVGDEILSPQARVNDWGFGSYGLTQWRVNQFLDSSCATDEFVVSGFSGTLVHQAGGPNVTCGGSRQREWLGIPATLTSGGEHSDWARVNPGSDATTSHVSVYFYDIGTTPSNIDLPDIVVDVDTIFVIPAGKRAWVQPGAAPITLGDTSNWHWGFSDAATIDVWYGGTWVGTGECYESGSTYTEPATSAGSGIWEVGTLSVKYIVEVKVDGIIYSPAEYELNSGLIGIPGTTGIESVTITFVTT